MNKRIFTQHQIQQIRSNPYVQSVSEKYVMYTDVFKQHALDQYLKEHIPAKEIFTQAGFDLDIIGHEIPRRCISRWRTHGSISRPKGRRKVYDDKDVEIAYLRAENAFLKKLRAQRAEK